MDSTYPLRLPGFHPVSYLGSPNLSFKRKLEPWKICDSFLTLCDTSTRMTAAVKFSPYNGICQHRQNVHKDGDFPNEPHIMLQSHTEVQDLNYKTGMRVHSCVWYTRTPRGQTLDVFCNHSPVIF